MSGPSGRNQLLPGMFAPQGPNAVMGWNGTIPSVLFLGPELYIQSSQLRVLSGSGTVTSVGFQTGSTGLTVSVAGGGGVNPITNSGTFVLAGTLLAPSGGTGISTYTTGDLLQALNSSTLQRLLAVATGNVLLSGGVGAVSFWGKVGLTTHVTGVLPVANGGVNLTTYATGDIIYASGANTLSRLAASTNGFVLTLSGGVPVWAAVTGTGTVTSVNVSGLGTGMTFTGGPITSSGSITMAGVLDADNGGTGQSTYTIGDLIQATGATTLSKLSAVATGNVLLSGGVATASSWGKVGLTTHIIGTLATANGGTNLTAYVTGDILYASATNTLARLPIATNGYVLTLVAGLPAWAAPTSGGGGSVTSVGLTAPSIYTVTGSPVTASGNLGFTLNTQTANMVWAGPSSGAAAAPTFRGLVLADLPAWVIEDIPAGSYTFTQADNNKIKRFVDTNPQTLTIPTGLSTGWNCIVVRGATAGVPTIASLGTYEGAGNTLDTPNTWAQIVHRGGNVHMAAGAFTGLTNTAANTELAMSNGSDLVPSGVFIPALGNVNLGTGLSGSTRAIASTGTATDIDLTISTKGAGRMYLQGQYYHLGLPTNGNSARGILAEGSSANINLQLSSKGQAPIEFSTGDSGSGSTSIRFDGFTDALTMRVKAYDNAGSGLNGTGLKLIAGSNTNVGGNASGGSILVQSGQRRVGGTGVDGNILIDTLNGNLALLTGTAPNFQAGQKITYITNAVVVPTGNPTGGGFLYVEAGVLKYRGTSGTVTTIAAA